MEGAEKTQNSTFSEVLVLYKKRYGRMTVAAWLNSELERSNCFVTVLVGILLTVAGIAVRAWVGSPYPTILALGISEITPPAWVMTLVWSLWFFVIGCAAGFVLAYRCPGIDGEKYRGVLLFVLLAFLELAWYPTLFGAQLVFLSVLESVGALCLSLAVTFAFYRVTKFAGMLMLLHDVWLLYMMILNFALLIRV